MGNIDTTCVNAIRALSADAVQKANSGHPGLPLGAAPIAYELWAHHMKHNGKNPNWANRDRFILSAGHGSAMLYSLLHLFGYGLTLDDLKNFRQDGSLTPGHPEYRHTKGVEATTGPLGAGMTQKELEEEGNRWLQNMVQRGLRAQLRTGNLLTGQLYVSLDFFPQAKPAEMRSVQGDLMELPTVGNSLDEFQQQIAEILAKINKVPFDQIGRDLQQTLAGMRRTVNAAEKTVKGLNDNLAPQLMGTIQSLKKTLDSADRTLVSANRTLASDSPTQEELQQTLRSVSKAADSLRRLTDYLERHPESLLRGKTGN